MIYFPGNVVCGPNGAKSRQADDRLFLAGVDQYLSTNLRHFVSNLNTVKVSFRFEQTANLVIMAIKEQHYETVPLTTD